MVNFGRPLQPHGYNHLARLVGDVGAFKAILNIQEYRHDWGNAGHSVYRLRVGGSLVARPVARLSRKFEFSKLSAQSLLALAGGFRGWAAAPRHAMQKCLRPLSMIANRIKLIGPVGAVVSWSLVAGGLLPHSC